MAKKRTTNGKSRRRQQVMANQPQQQPAQPQQGAQQTFAADPQLLQQAQAAGLDLSGFDWKSGAILFLTLLLQYLQKTGPQELKALTGCPHDGCCQLCHAAMIDALNSAHKSYQCCGRMAQP
jgi:hypothetical protein